MFFRTAGWGWGGGFQFRWKSTHRACWVPTCAGLQLCLSSSARRFPYNDRLFLLKVHSLVVKVTLFAVFMAQSFFNSPQYNIPKFPHVKQAILSKGKKMNSSKKRQEFFQKNYLLILETNDQKDVFGFWIDAYIQINVTTHKQNSKGTSTPQRGVGRGERNNW